MFHTSSNPTSGEFWAAHFYGTGVLRPGGTEPTGLWSEAGMSLMNRSVIRAFRAPLGGELWKRFCAPSDTKQLLTLHDQMRRSSKQ